MPMHSIYSRIFYSGKYFDKNTLLYTSTPVTTVTINYFNRQPYILVQILIHLPCILNRAISSKFKKNNKNPHSKSFNQRKQIDKGKKISQKTKLLSYTA